MTRKRRHALVAAVAVLGLLATSCGDDEDATASAGDGHVSVFAAASLTAAFTAIGTAFTAANDGATVSFNFASSSDLMRQINEGAAADVFASADEANMQKLSDSAGTTGEPEVFATNLLRIIVEPSNPKGITGVADLADPDLVFVTAAPEVPIGRYTAEVFAKAGITVTPKSLEENVKAIVTKVTLGEADAGIVYATDVLAAGGDAEGIDIPVDLNVVASYPIAVPSGAADPDTAAAFVDFVLSPAGQAVLSSYGFASP